MNEPINEKVTVLTIYDRIKGTVFPKKMRWQGRDYMMTKLGYYHLRPFGKYKLHVFDVTDGNTDFRLVCNPINLHWILETISDGNTT